MRGAHLGWFLSVALVGLVSACGEPPEDGQTALPEGFPLPVVPDHNPLTPEKVELGRRLFYDARLSGNAEQSCGSCHRQDLAFSDGRTTAVGSTGELHPRNSPTLTNVVYNGTLTWANPLLLELEDQLLVPIFGEFPVELGATGHESEILGRLIEDERYPELFARAFAGADDPIVWTNVVRALASFVRTLVSSDSPFDRYAYGAEGGALSPGARRGMELFFSERLECHHCHGGFNFTVSVSHAGSEFRSEPFHNTGLYDIDGKGAYPPDNTGVYGVSGDPADMGKFRAPTLRNVAVTAPYMHDGSISTLEDVLRFYEAGGREITGGPYAGDGRASPLKSGLVAGFSLTDAERRDLLHFLDALTDETFLSDPALADPFEDE